MSVTKYELSFETLARITEARLSARLSAVEPLTAGLCNALYALTLEDGRRCVLKAASPGKAGLRRGEAWLMETELEAMRLAGSKGIPVPAILTQDDGGNLCEAPYFIMSFVPGTCMGTMTRTWSVEEKEYWYGEIGRLAKRIASIEGDAFGILASGRTFPDNFSFFVDFFSLLLADAEDGRIDLGVSPDRLASRLNRSRTALEAVDVPCLVHYDLWENNLMVEDGKIVGVLDWERAVFGDPLMEERFRNYAVHPAFLAAYGKTAFTPAETERCLWYDMAMDAALMIEVFFRGYADTRQYDRAKGRFLKAWEKLGGIG